MTHIEGDGVIEDIYYLLWRKDSPFNEKLNLRIPDTVVFRRGRPMAWYFTNSEGAVLRKKPTSLTYPEILKKFTKGADEGGIVSFFINIDEEKKLSRLLDKTQFRGLESQDTHDDQDEIPNHKVEYFGLKEFTHLFSDYKNFENKTGILQRFINPYGSNNELIQAIWSPRVCVFTKRVNLRRLNETRFDVYERALTFDGPDFYSKNVPLRGGYIPGKLRATCDNIVRHIAYISYEKISIKRIVGYFKVDKNENVWFLWTSSIRIKETSKTHKKMSQYIDKPLCLEPCMQTDENIRHIKSNFSSKPVSLQMNEQCIICNKRVDKISMIPVVYKLLLSNELILRKSEQQSDTKIRVYSNTQNTNSAEKQPLSVRKGTIGVPIFLKKLHPGLTFKEFTALREKDHFLMMKTEVCEECYLLVSKEYEGGFPYKLTETKKRPITGTVRSTYNLRSFDNTYGRDSSGHKERIYSVDNIQVKDDLDDSNEEIDANAIRLPTINTDRDSRPSIKEQSDLKFKGKRVINVETDVFSIPSKYTPSTNHGFSSTNAANTTKSNSVPSFVNGAAWIKTAKKLAKLDHGGFDSHLEETKLDTSHFDTTLKRDLMKALGATDTDTSIKMRSTQSAKGLKAVRDIQQADAAYNIKPSRPQTTSATNILKQGRSFKTVDDKAYQLKYKLNEPSDIFADSSENLSEFEEVLEKKTMLKQNKKSRNSLGAQNEYKRTKQVSPEAKLQDHLDQDMVLLMANASQGDSNQLTSNINPITNKPKAILSNSVLKKARDAQDGNINDSPDSGRRTGKSGVGSNRVRFKKQNTFDENHIIKELEEQVDTMIQEYCK